MLAKNILKLGLLSLTMTAALPVHATIISGNFNFSGSLQAFGNQEFDFFPFGGTDGTITLGASGFTGDFVGAENTTGTIKDQSTPPGPGNIPNFFTLAALPTYNFTMTSVNNGVFGGGQCFVAAAAGQTCTTPGSIVNFVNLTNNASTASYQLEGTVQDGSGDPASTFVATFTASFANQSYQQVLLQLLAKGFVETTFAVDVTVTPGRNGEIPEPSSMLMLGGGLSVLGLIARRRMSIN
jgi:hypothetical protein